MNHGVFMANYSSMLSGSHVFLNYLICYFTYGQTYQIIFKLQYIIENSYVLSLLKISSVIILYLSIQQLILRLMVSACMSSQVFWKQIVHFFFWFTITLTSSLALLFKSLTSAFLPTHHLTALCLLTLVPQIWRNSIKGFRETPCIAYALSVLAQGLILPTYIQMSPTNVLFKRPVPMINYLMGVVGAIALQVWILYKQKTRPRFLIPKVLKEKILCDEDFHRYERSFEDEANRSSNSYISNDSLIDQLRERPSNSQLKRQRSTIRLQKIRAQECVICMQPLGSIVQNQVL